MNPYASPEIDSPLDKTPIERWTFLSRLKFFLIIAIGSTVLSIVCFQAPFVLYGGRLAPNVQGYELCYRWIFASIGIGLPIQFLMSTVVYNRRLAIVMAIGNSIVLLIQLFFALSIANAFAAVG